MKNKNTKDFARLPSGIKVCGKTNNNKKQTSKQKVTNKTKKQQPKIKLRHRHRHYINQLYNYIIMHTKYM